METKNTGPEPGLDRRGFLKLGFTGTALLSLASLSASLTGCSGPVLTASGYRFLREADVQLLRALLPSLIGAALPEDPAARERIYAETLKRFDETCARVLAPGQAGMRGLFDLMNSGLTRRLTTGVTKPWAEVSEAEATEFLERWRTSSVSLYTAGYKALSKTLNLSAFGIAETWAKAGYDGPYAPVFQVANS